MAAAAVAAPPVRGYCPAAASTSSVARVRMPASFVSAPRRVSVRLRAAAVAEVPRGLQLRREEERGLGFFGGVFGGEEEEVVEKVGEERVEGWMRESIAEIVRHIGEAPFLVHLFNDDDGGSGRGGAGRVTVRRETASAESWPDVRRRWGPGGMRRPDGIILVEQIAAAVEEGGASAGAGAAEAARQVWGLVVQARGMECASCYVLDTCRVRSPAGLCTHFCLARAQCFGDPLELQLRNAWLNRLSGRR
ncbi:uncharacterized protein [Oryza sativa Japonica Group]|jgi:hypothetical protein|uniref:DUF7804 domain-containing protein n=7 Tax=Oryza TaxID=4527 RepID=A0A8J8XDR1_ORYSJ|nr:uncharacterized protein LOC4334034 [Oryza sativa Japonica Group]AAP03420.1 unknown protein [Oryza sativa Japonica Group]AAR07081.1 unknown protein [Oryza sativa Japonica Group]ABF98754.1 expressed protein [Oryza sativa Japonica Group]EAZ28508.1 hypothetical protein OsJ_12489 [Oryza sativa Japonica Group]KAF2941200.1 hypothetical protein DAI22_03g330400 [Oryza sativa Japonica Group]